ncbi:peroxisomal membrane anchor protein conserved region-domain-containing protein [Syncephalis fuscata]|nr:peroxisomal membrane anchor protein conserved region-domain-containing protein [Syncephalis fuscata]
MREELVSSAVNFLQDAKVQSASMAKKVSFLESKGMTSDEIQEAMRRAGGGGGGSGGNTAMNSNNNNSQAMMSAVPAGYGPVMMQAPPPPPPPALGWKDYFIAAVVIGGVGYGAAMIAKRYVGPMFNWPKKNELDEDKRRFEEAFDKAKEALDDMAKTTQATREQMEKRADSIEQVVAQTKEVLEELGQREEKREKELNSVREELDRVRNALPKILEQSKESHSMVLTDLQSEIRSLKGLLANRGRGPTAVPSTSGTISDTATATNYEDTSTGTTALGYTTTSGYTASSSTNTSLTSLIGNNQTTGRPTIPAWQLAGNAISTKNTSTNANSSSSAQSTPTLNSTTANTNSTVDGSASTLNNHTNDEKKQDTV